MNRSVSDDWNILRKIPMDGTAHECLIWKLSILAVKHRSKPVFLYAEFESPTRGQIVSKFAARIGLAVTLNTRRRRLVDLSSPVDVARYANGEPMGLWICRKDNAINFATELEALTSGELRNRVPLGSLKNQGNLLGYPSCCVKWYEENIEKPQGLRYLKFLREKDLLDVEAVKRAVQSPEFLASFDREFSSSPSNATVEDNQSRTILCKSISSFPFIPHVACPSCLLSAQGNECPSALANSRFAELAKSASISLYESIIENSRDESKRIENRILPPDF